MRRIFILTVLLSCTTIAMAQGRYAYEWLNLSVNEEMTARQVISWRTDPSRTEAYAQIAPLFLEPGLEHVEMTKIKAVSSIETDYGTTKCYHKAFFEGLQPGKKYVYRIGDGKKWSEWYTFKTEETSDKPFTFIYMGDVQRGIMDQYPRIVRAAFGKAPDASVILFAGDLANIHTDENLCDFFDANDWMIAQARVAPVPDNHDFRLVDGVKTISTYWHHMFYIPKTSSGDVHKYGNYYFDFQGCRFIGLDTKQLYDRTADEETFAWFEKSLAENPCRWTVICMHQPVINCLYGRKAGKMMERIKDLSFRYGVDLILSGHDHIYTKKINYDEKGKGGTPVYITSVAGSPAKVPAYNTAFDRTGSNMQLFQIVSVSPEKIVFSAYDAAGELYDSFRIENKNNRKKVVDCAPKRPERTELPNNWVTSRFSQKDLRKIDSLRIEYNKNHGVK